jgi:predicted O-linked N-acetylglucosamine transferase (SPINDLY family)
MSLDTSLQRNIQLEIERALQLATAQHQAGGLQLAEELYLTILQLNPSHPDANHNLGVLAVQKNQPAAGLSYFLAALDADPARAQYWISYINALFQADQREKAQQVLALARQQGLKGDEVEALALQLEGTQTPVAAPDVSTAVANDNLKKPKAKPVLPPKKYPGLQEINALSALFNKGRYAEVLPLAKKMTERYPMHGQGWKALGIAFIQTAKNAEALVPMKKAAELLPDDIGVHNYLGNTLNEMGYLKEAEASYQRILQIKPNHAEAYSNLGNNLKNQGRLNEAEASYSMALQLNPNYAEAHNNLGNTLWELSRLDEAETSFRRAIQLKPDFVAAHCNLGNNLRSQGKLNEAEASYRQALKLKPTFVEAHNNLAVTLKELGRLDEAVTSCRRAVEIKPDYAEAHSNLGAALRETGKLEDAVVSFRRALALKPNFAEASSNLGGILRVLGQLDEAVERCRNALQIQPDYAEAHCNLAGALKELGRLDEAEASCRRALQIKPDYVEVHSNLGTVLQAQGKFDAAINSHLTALTLRPDFQEARMNLGFAQLSCGQLTEGWKNHEFRIELDKKRFPHLPFWAGENLHGKSILVSGEQGIGDEIMFASQYAEIIAQADRCVIECTRKLVPLFTRSFPQAFIVPKLNPPHPATQVKFDYQCAAGSLAQWLRPNLASFPQQNNSLKADPARVAYWKTRLAELGPGPKIGFCWRSGITTGERNLHYTTLDQWGPIFTLPGVHFINLQYDECSAELNEARQHFGVPLHAFTEVDMYNELNEAAALIKALDLVISAPTSVYTIAAAQGVNTWVMTSGVAWFTHGTEHSPWYPTLRFFNRQWNQPWDEIIKDVSSQLYVGKTQGGETLSLQEITCDTSLQQTILEEINKALCQAVTQHQAGQLQVAEELYLAILQLNPNQPDANHNLGVLSVQTNQPVAALPYFLTALNADPTRGQYWISYIDALIQAGHLADAKQVLALSRQQGLQGDGVNELTLRLEDSKQTLVQKDNRAALEESLTAATLPPPPEKPAKSNTPPQNGQPSSKQINAAVISFLRGRYLETITLAQKLIERYPRHNFGWKVLGSAYIKLGKHADSLYPLQKSIELSQNDAEAHSNLGNVLAKMGRSQEAEVSCRRALQLKPDYAEAHNNLGKALFDLQRIKEAVVNYRRAVEINPDYAEAYNNLGSTLPSLLLFDEAEASYRQALRIKPDYNEAFSNLLFCMSQNERIEPQILFAEHCRFAEQFEAPLRANWPQHTNTKFPDRSLQIGIVSGDLYDHAIASFIEPLLIHISQLNQLSLHAYANHIVDDSVSQRLRGYFAHWHPVSALSDAALAEKIQTDGIDILIDLSGHTANNRLLTFARKPAPVQASWMGYPGTTGLPAMDYYLADRYFLPPSQFDDQFTEKIARLPANAPFLPSESAPAVNALPALSNGYVTFGSFNRLNKINQPVIALWSQILRALPDSRMVLGGMPEEGKYDTLIEWFAQEGIARERLDFHARSGMEAYMELHHQVDICLDTFPYNGGTTNYHALWMGVPTLTLTGSTAAGRPGLAILSRVGLEIFAAHNTEGFVQKGLLLVGNLAALSDIRNGLRERFAQSAVGQPELIAAGLERALRIMWQRWCDGLPAESFEVNLQETTNSTLETGE